MTIKVKPSNNIGSKVGQDYITGSKSGSHKLGLDVLPKAMFPTNGLITDLVEVGSTTNTIIATAHGAREGDVLRFTTGLNVSVEASVNEVVDANTMQLGLVLDNVPVAGDEFLLMRYITLTLDPNGALSTTSGPLTYIRDSIATNVEKDTATPANTRALPVELVSTTGIEATFNVTTGDLNIATTAFGANPDSMIIGDGTNLMAVNANLEALVHDTDMLASTGLVADAAVINPALSATLIANGKGQLQKLIDIETALGVNTTATENYYKRDFTGSPLTTASGFVNLRTLTASISKINITNNSGNELVIRNATSGIQIVVGQGAVFSQALVGIATDVIEISAITANAIDGIIYINFEG